MIFGRARPEYAILLFDLLVRNAIVICIAAPGSYSQFFEDLARTFKLKVLTATHASSELLHDPPVLSGLTRRIRCLVDFDDTAFAIRRNSFVFSPRGTRQHHVR